MINSAISKPAINCNPVLSGNVSCNSEIKQCEQSIEQKSHSSNPLVSADIGDTMDWIDKTALNEKIGQAEKEADKIKENLKSYKSLCSLPLKERLTVYEKKFPDIYGLYSKNAGEMAEIKYNKTVTGFNTFYAFCAGAFSSIVAGSLGYGTAVMGGIAVLTGLSAILIPGLNNKMKKKYKDKTIDVLFKKTISEKDFEYLLKRADLKIQKLKEQSASKDSAGTGASGNENNGIEDEENFVVVKGIKIDKRKCLEFLMQ